MIFSIVIVLTCIEFIEVLLSALIPACESDRIIISDGVLMWLIAHCAALYIANSSLWKTVHILPK